MEDVTERWLPVVGWEGLYEVSDRGRVRSLDRWVPNKWGSQTLRTGVILKPGIDQRMGYRRVALCAEGKVKHWPVHRLVLTAFAGPCPEGQHGRHGPGGPADNRWPENLCWGTPLENHADMKRDGTDPLGERNPRAKLTEESVRVIRERYAAGETQDSLANAYGVVLATIYYVVNRKTWRHVA